MSAAALSQDECIIAKTAADGAAVLDEVIQVVGQFRWRWLRRDNRLQGLFKLRDIALQHIPNYAETYKVIWLAAAEARYDHDCLIAKLKPAHDRRAGRDFRHDVEGVGDALRVCEPHARAEAHRADPVVGRRRTVLKRPFDVLDAGATVLRDDLRLLVVKDKGESPADGMDANVDLEFVGGDSDAADQLVVDAGVFHHLLDLVRGLAGVRKVVVHDDELPHRIVGQTAALAFRRLPRLHDGLALKPGELIGEFLHEDACHVALGDDADEIALLVKDGETSERIVLEILDRERKWHILLKDDKVRRHVLLAGVADPLPFERLDDVLNRDDAEKPPILQHGHAGDLIPLHQVLGIAQRVRPDDGGNVVAAHHVLHPKALQKFHHHERFAHTLRTREAQTRNALRGLLLVRGHNLVIAALLAARQNGGFVVHRSIGEGEVIR